MDVPLYEIKDGKLKPIREEDFKLEKDLQKLCDDNLETLFSLKLVKSQFAIENFRIDSLAFDEETKAFVVIEYKKVRTSALLTKVTHICLWCLITKQSVS